MVGGVLASPSARAARAVRAAARASFAGIPFAALALLAASLGQGCSVGSLRVPGDGGNALATDGGEDALPIASIDGSTCQPGDVRTFVPAAYRPATPVWQDVCTGTQISAFYTACIDPNATPASCQTFYQMDPANPTCAACILTPESMTNYGPLVDHGSFITENVGGCIELTDPTGLVCAKAQQALAGCDLAACEANCPVHDVASRAALDQCTAAAEAAGCQMFAAQASCALQAADAGSSSAACDSATFHDFYDLVVPLFCGPPSAALEGGAPHESGAPDGPTSDGSSGDAAANDGSSESGEASASDAASSDGPVDAPAE